VGGEIYICRLVLQQSLNGVIDPIYAVPFRGGSSSKVKSGFFELFMRSITFGPFI
jgi:hypothetical protein